MIDFALVLWKENEFINNFKSFIRNKDVISSLKLEAPKRFRYSAIHYNWPGKGLHP